MFTRKFFISLIILIGSMNLYSITITVLPFTSANQEWIDEYMVDDGMPRTLEYSLINTHMFDITDYDLLISYFASYDIVASYKTLQTNLQIASQFIKETFDSDYMITGEVLNFDLKKGGKDTASVEFEVNIVDINTLSILKTFTNAANYTLPNDSPVYKSEDALFYESALGRASVLAFSKIAEEISAFLNKPPLNGIVTRVEGSNIFINLGKINDIKIGDKFEIYQSDRYLDMPTASNNINTNISNIPKNYFDTEENNDKEYKHIRSNENGDVWYTSEMLYRYRFFKNREEFITSAEVIELYEHYSVLENRSDKKVDLMMRVRIKEEE